MPEPTNAADQVKLANARPTAQLVLRSRCGCSGFRRPGLGDLRDGQGTGGAHDQSSRAARGVRCHPGGSVMVASRGGGRAMPGVWISRADPAGQPTRTGARSGLDEQQPAGLIVDATVTRELMLDRGLAGVAREIDCMAVNPSIYGGCFARQSSGGGATSGGRGARAASPRQLGGR